MLWPSKLLSIGNMGFQSEVFWSHIIEIKIISKLSFNRTLSSVLPAKSILSHKSQIYLN